MSVRHALLALLSEGPKYGFQLARSSRPAPASVAAEHRPGVHDPAAARARRAGRVRRQPTTARRRASASPTPGGRSSTTGCSTPPDTSSPPRDELVIKVLVALRVPGVDAAELAQLTGAT